jgi:hypothetical protein
MSQRGIAMPVTLKVKAKDAGVKIQREVAAQRVIDYFGVRIPDSRLLCFLDDEDPSTVRGERGPANRGLYEPIHNNTPLAEWPEYVTNCISVDDHVSPLSPGLIDDLIYLYGSTCADEVGLTMTLPHELQHAIQHRTVRKLWAENSLISNLDRKVIDTLRLKSADIPIEREARIVSKRAAICLFGAQRVRQYIDRKISERISKDDVADWRFVRTLIHSSSVDLVGGTQLIFEQLRDWRSELENVLQEMRGNPDFSDIDFDALFLPMSPDKR